MDLALSLFLLFVVVGSVAVLGSDQY